MYDHPAPEPHPAAASEILEPRTRIPRAAHARALLHEPEVDPSFVALLQEVLPDEEACRADRLVDADLTTVAPARNPPRY